eukprot:scaffold208572_cov51-Cyclotella_meneghiniana.AAC.1
MSDGAFTLPHTIQSGVNEDRHENQAPKKATVFSCPNQNDPRVNSMAVDVSYQYELIILRHASNTEALLGAEDSIMRDLSNTMGCTQLHNLRRMEESNKVLGFQWFDGDHVNVQCTGEANDPLLTCTPTQAQFMVFLEPETSIELVEKTKNLMLSTIRDGMSNGRYTSDSVNQVIFADADALSSDEALSNDEEITNENNLVSMQNTKTTESGFPGYAILAIVLCFFAIVIGLYLVKRSKRNRNIAPDNRKRKSVVSFSSLRCVPPTSVVMERHIS